MTTPIIYVTVDTGADCKDWHLKTLERLINGIKGLERDGYKIERYAEFENRATQKWILSISHDSESGGESKM